ncbi:MAG: L,D-transpeptidase family protein [Chloroflexi bacterium]|nr:L,D-transpeptidase family protein [Chloroflexota bacterium]
MRRNLSVLGLAITLLGSVLILASCGQPAPFALPQIELFHHTPAEPQLPPPATASALNPKTGAAIQPNSWTNAGQVQLTADLSRPMGDGDVLEAQFLPVGQLLDGKPNVTGEPGQTALTSPSMEAGQQYHWEVRVSQPGALPSAWLLFPGSIGYQPTSPAAPSIHALPRNGWVGDRQVQLNWDASGDPAGVAGYAYTIDQSASTAPPNKLNATAAQASVNVPKDGDWYFHLATIDGAGNMSSPATTQIHVDSAPLQLDQVKFTGDGAFNPSVGPTTLDVSASKPAQLSLSVVPENSATAVKTWNLGEKQTASVQWDGKDDKGQALPAGNYRFRLDGSDKTGRMAQSLTDDALLLTDKRIVVSLSQERLVAYEGDKPVFDTLVTTGGPELPTPIGTYHILQKFSPFTFKSPWPKGSPFWYADSPTSYAMLFESSGYFIHDAPWRSWYGPGSNATTGTPGGNGTGTHGCVNVPLAVQAKLFAWTDVGTPVIVQN